MDIMIRNESSENDTMVVFKVGLILSGNIEWKNKDNLLIREKVNAKDQKIFIASDKESKNDWKEAAEGLARMIEDRSNEKR